MTAGAVQLGPDRFDITSGDGTRIAVWVAGRGPALVLVHGSLQDHRASGGLVDALSDGITTYSMDRRGHGVSGDASRYSIEQEFEDVAAVVDAVASHTNAPVSVWGHSYGAGCAMGGAAISRNVGRLVLYEPGLGLRYPAGAIEAVERMVAAGDYETALITVLVDVVGMTLDDIDQMRTNPFMSWQDRLATVPTIPRECRAEDEWEYRPGRFDSVTAPTVLLAGSESPPEQVEATRRAAQAIRGARIRVLEGHAHVAHRTDPQMVADLIRELIAT